MGNEKIGIRELRKNLAGYLESGTPLAIIRHGETPSFYIPAHQKSRSIAHGREGAGADANILIRADLGPRVRRIVESQLRSGCDRRLIG